MSNLVKTLATLLLTAPASMAAVNYAGQIKPLLQLHCVKCHGANAAKNQLRLDTAAAMLKGGGRGPVVEPNAPERSLLLQAINGAHHEIPRMPYKRTPLDSADIELIRLWIAEGAAHPEDELPSDDRHWAFIKPERPAVPNTAPHPIDAFVHQRLRQAGLAPAPAAGPLTLLRRLHLDLIGLPPSLEEIASFETDFARDADSAYSRRVSHLLNSPHYGERWGRWWLDQARYADSNGYSIDAPRLIWKYRDWVVQAFNAGQPFDQFTVEQIAGDLLPDASESQRIATGFHRNTQINQEGGIDKEQFRIESIFDRVATTGTVWLGLSTGCAQCHDHKFDPISQREYYQLFAFLNNQDEPSLTLHETGIDSKALAKEKQALTRELDAHVQSKTAELAAWETGLNSATRKRLSGTAKKALAIASEKRGPNEHRALYAAMTGTGDPVFNPLHSRLSEIDDLLSKGVSTMVLAELPAPRSTRVFIKGDFTRPAEEVPPGVPAVLHSIESSTAMPTRLDFARWLVSPQNPLTARVIMNRVWQQYFGRGLVETENDFGTQGSLPTHPELLDWLATEFMASGWDLKAMHRLIVTSETYQQSSHQTPSSDPTNLLLARQNRLRLDAEIIRDVALAASGLLQPNIGGPPVFPPIPEGVMGLGQVKRAWTTSSGPDRYRRALYTFTFRSTPPPNLAVFDAPDAFAACTRRLRSNTPLQALTLLNDPAFIEFAGALAKRIEHDGLKTSFQRVLTRPAQRNEIALLKTLPPLSAARVLLNLDETITRE